MVKDSDAYRLEKRATATGHIKGRSSSRDEKRRAALRHFANMGWGTPSSFGLVRMARSRATGSTLLAHFPLAEFVLFHNGPMCFSCLLQGRSCLPTSLRDATNRRHEATERCALHLITTACRVRHCLSSKNHSLHAWSNCLRFRPFPHGRLAPAFPSVVLICKGGDRLDAIRVIHSCV